MFPTTFLKPQHPAASAAIMAICSTGVQCGHPDAELIASSLSPWQRISRVHCGTAPKPRSQRQCCHSLVLGSLVGFLGRCSRDQRSRKPQLWLASSSRTELLVDGDCHSVDAIKQAIGLLKDQGHNVDTTLFAPPERCRNKKWSTFMQEAGISFRAIHRSSKNLLAEPNDKAITKAMQQLSKLPSVRIALLVQDIDFADAILDLQSRGTNVVVLIPACMFGTIQNYERQGIKVLEMPTRGRGRSQVRAILDRDGSGSVELVDENGEPDSRDMFAPIHEEVARLIQDLGYGEANHGNLVSKCVKFWYTNQLGSLTVFPFQPAVKAVHSVLAESRFAVERNCKEYLRKLAYFLPITAKRGRLKKNEEKTFGYAKARAVFRGGGPFILEDSPDLAIRALTRLGFLDQFNTDVPEAMFLFLNSAENKGSLRKFGWLPGPGDNHVDVDRNLRVAFLSDLTGGRWQIKNPTRSIKPVLQILEKKQNYSSGAFCQLLS